jgi:hypothetical protein
VVPLFLFNKRDLSLNNTQIGSVHLTEGLLVVNICLGNSFIGKVNMKKSPILFLTFFVFLSITACQSAAPGAGVETSATSQATAIVDVASFSGPSSPLGSVSYTMSGQAPDYQLKVETPALRDSGAPHAADFGRAVTGVIQKEVEAFKKNLNDVAAASNSTSNSFDLKYVLVSPPGSYIYSLQFKISEYLAGAAHPSNYTVVFNYNINQGQEISLDQLFTPGANYLQPISDYCKSELGKRAIGFDARQHGADAAPENYRNWNISADGLVITFDEYQVAPYAAGPQVVVVPYGILKEIINLHGPLANFTK